MRGSYTEYHPRCDAIIGTCWVLKIITRNSLLWYSRHRDLILGFDCEVETSSASLLSMASCSCQSYLLTIRHNANAVNYTTQLHTVGAVMLITQESGLDAVLVRFSVNKWLEHLRHGVRHKVPSTVRLYMSAHGKPLVQSNCSELTFI